MKTNRSKGFTLIELMVVISIIALLSSVVLASIKSAREKAMITKTVSEMKSMQTALELYRTQFGEYPINMNGDLNYDDDFNCKHLCKFGDYGNLDFLQTELVDKGFLSKLPHAPNYPDSCDDNCATSGYILGYSLGFSDMPHKALSEERYLLCGGERIKNYMIYFYANDKEINLPNVELMFNGNFYSNVTDHYSLPVGNVYCLAM